MARQTGWKGVERKKEGRDLRGSRIKFIDGAVHIPYLRDDRDRPKLRAREP